MKQYPNLNLEIDYVNRAVDVLSEGMDLAIRLGITGPPELITTKLGQLRYGVYAAPSYLEGRSEIRSIQDLGSLELNHFQPEGEKGIEASWSMKMLSCTQSLEVQTNGFIPADQIRKTAADRCNLGEYLQHVRRVHKNPSGWPKLTPQHNKE